MCARLRSPIRLVAGVVALALLAANCRPAEPLPVETLTVTLEPTPTLTPIPSTATPTPEPKTLTVCIAFAHCIDRVGLDVSAAAVPADELPWTLSSDKAIVYAYDPDRGRALLAEAGWTDTKGDGVADRGGVPFEVTLLTTTSPARRESAELIRDDVAACGVRIKLEFLEPGKLFAEGPESPLYGRQFDLVEFAWLANDLSVCQTWRSDRIPSDTVGFAGSYQNYSGYRNPDFDAACKAHLRGVMEADRQRAEEELIALFAEDLPSLPLFWREWHTGARAEVIGFGLDPFAAELWNIEEIDVQP